MILDDIVAARRADVARAKREVSPAALAARPGYGEPRRGFIAALRGQWPSVIAEVKKASPSKGVIRADFDPRAIARSYADGGAAAISVLTEERFFQGALQHLEEIRALVGVPLLRKDFLFDPYQLVEARSAGADAVLLIVAMLEPTQLGELHSAATELGLDVLVEAHTAAEVEAAVAVGARLIGVNNRDLHTFATSLATAERLRRLIPPGRVTVAESGIDTAADVRRMRAAGYDALLIGESFMRARQPGAALRDLLASARGEDDAC
jgi:indole-3-glycerol phosphate synthase